MKHILIVSLLSFLVAGLFAQSPVRIKDIATVETTGSISLIGYGLVVGLDGSGDRSGGRRGSIFTVQSISNMLEKFGITVPAAQLRTRNAASVMVTATVPPFARSGVPFDVTISSLGDAKSLEGGILLMTPLMSGEGKQYGMAQGAVSIGGYNIVTGAGERVKKNHALVGRLPGGGVLTIPTAPSADAVDGPLFMNLEIPDFVTASRVAQAVNDAISTADNELAKAISPRTVEISLPDSVNEQSGLINLIAMIELLTVQPDVEAKVVINERTGTIVAGGNVTVGEVLISHGNLTIHTRRSPVISQPAAFGGGQTVVDQITETTAEEDGNPAVVVPENTTVSDLAASLNRLGVKPRDLIAIFQAIDHAGALRAKLEIF
ncbi:MAG: flagellar basal body P-ring protein FlgI [Calditrichia bacterium]